MIRKLIGLLLIIGALLGLKELHHYWEQVKTQQAAKDRQSNGAAGPAAPAPATMDGMPALAPSLEASLREAKGQGPAALKLWIEKHRPYVPDPRLAGIELDYVVLIGGRNYLEAKKIFHAIKQRTPTNSPVYSRIQQLEKNYQ